ncbi:acyltransferase [Thermodesulfobacteriota bacterium]
MVRNRNIKSIMNPSDTKNYPVRDLLPFALDYAYEFIRRIHSTFYSRILAKWWGVDLGRGCQFTGTPYFRKHPTAKISIGSICVFRSAEWSNSIGLNRRCFISASRNAEIVIGRESGFSSTIITANKAIHIGNHVLCGGNCTICDNDRHSIDLVERRNNLPGQAAAPIIIEDDVFLGMNTVVLKGVKIGYGTFVAANSVVVDSLPEKVLAGGHPARIIRHLT